jgi:antitoxin ParD1/3/4
LKGRDFQSRRKSPTTPNNGFSRETSPILANHAIMVSKEDAEGSAMPTRNVNLTPELDRFVATKIKSGRYENASEVVRAGLRTLKRQERERHEKEHAAKLDALRSAIDEGDASGVARGNVFGRVRKTLKLSASR